MMCKNMYGHAGVFFLLAMFGHVSANGEGFRPLYIDVEKLPQMVQGELEGAETRLGTGIKVTIRGPSETFQPGGKYKFEVMIEPGDRLSDRDGWIYKQPEKIRGHGLSRVILATKLDGIQLRNLKIELIDPMTTVEQWKKVISYTFGGFKEIALDQIKQGMDEALRDRKSSLFIHAISPIEIENPFDISEVQGPRLQVYTYDLGGEAIAEMNKIRITFEVICSREGPYCIILLPDIRGIGRGRPRGVLTGISPPYGIEYRQELILRSGASSAAETHPYFPLATGNKWTYQTRVQTVVPGFVENPLEEGLTTFAVIGKKRINNRECILVREGMNESYYYMEEGRVMLAGSRGFASVEEFLQKQGLRIALPAVYLERSLSPGNSLVRGRIIGTRPEMSMVSRIVGSETVNVPAGYFHGAIKVESRLSTSQMGEIVVMDWFAKDVGKVKGLVRARLGGGATKAIPVTAEMVYLLSSYNMRKSNLRERQKRTDPEKGETRVEAAAVWEALKLGQGDLPQRFRFKYLGEDAKPFLPTNPGFGTEEYVKWFSKTHSLPAGRIARLYSAILILDNSLAEINYLVCECQSKADAQRIAIRHREEDYKWLTRNPDWVFVYGNFVVGISPALNVQAQASHTQRCLDHLSQLARQRLTMLERRSLH